MIRTKCVYDPPSRDDGHRLLVMRLWRKTLANLPTGRQACLPAGSPVGA